VHLVLVGRALEGAHGVGGGVVVVIGDDLDHAPVHPAMSVDLLGRDHGGVRDGDAADGGVLRDHADADRVGGRGGARQAEGEGEGGQHMTH